jgi:hypothetical protein
MALQLPCRTFAINDLNAPTAQSHQFRSKENQCSGKIDATLVTIDNQ